MTSAKGAGNSFTIEYDPGKANPGLALQAIERQGFKPSLARPVKATVRGGGLALAGEAQQLGVAAGTKGSVVLTWGADKGAQAVDAVSYTVSAPEGVAVEGGNEGQAKGPKREATLTFTVGPKVKAGIHFVKVVVRGGDGDPVVLRVPIQVQPPGRMR